MKKKLLVVATAVFALTLIVPLSAFSQANDHLKCRHIEGADKVKAKVSIDALDDRFDVRRCKVKRARAYCTAGARIGIDPSPEFEFVEGDDFSTDYVCYKAKCRKSPDANIATDAFGTHRIRKLESKVLCVPAVSEPAA
jgi:hypothetical protein